MREYYSYNDAARNPHLARASAEAERFISALPPDFVSAQKTALTEAIAGDSRKLDAIRAARKTAPLARPEMDTDDIYIDSGANKLRLRVYTPRTPLRQSRSALLYLHGGGWAINCPEACERFCRDVAACADAIVVAPDYRLAPENPRPAADDDAFAAYSWLVGNAEMLGASPSKIFIGGDSAGGHLAALLALRVRDSDLRKPEGLVMFYPVLDLTGTSRLSYSLFGEGYCLNAELMCLFVKSYAPDADAVKAASPIFAELKGLPRTLLISSECDILHDEASEFAKKAADALVKIRYVCFEGATHIYITQRGMESAYGRALDETLNFIKKV